MPEQYRQHSSGALIFKPTRDEQLLTDTHKVLKEKTDELDNKLAEVDALLEKLKKYESL